MARRWLYIGRKTREGGRRSRRTHREFEVNMQVAIDADYEPSDDEEQALKAITIPSVGG